MAFTNLNVDSGYIDNFVLGDTAKKTEPTFISNDNTHLRYELAPTHIQSSELAKLVHGYSDGKWVVGYENRSWDKRISAINEQLNNGNLDRKEVGWARQEIERKLESGQYLAKKVKGNEELRNHVLNILEKMASYEVGVPTEKMDKEWMQNYLTLNNPAVTRKERSEAGKRIYNLVTATDKEFDQYKKDRELTTTERIGRGGISALVAIPVAFGSGYSLEYLFNGIGNIGNPLVVTAYGDDNAPKTETLVVPSPMFPQGHQYPAAVKILKEGNVGAGAQTVNKGSMSQTVTYSKQIDSLLEKYNSGEYSKPGLNRILHQAENIAKKSRDKGLQERVNSIAKEFYNGNYPKPVVGNQGDVYNNPSAPPEFDAKEEAARAQVRKNFAPLYERAKYLSDSMKEALKPKNPLQYLMNPLKALWVAFAGAPNLAVTTVASIPARNHSRTVKRIENTTDALPGGKYNYELKSGILDIKGTAERVKEEPWWKTFLAFGTDFWIGYRIERANDKGVKAVEKSGGGEDEGGGAGYAPKLFKFFKNFFS